MTTKRSGHVVFLDRYFYFSMSLLLAAVVVYGFSQTINEDLLHASPVPPFILWIHAMVYPGWVLFFILQSGLVRTHNVGVHRVLGWFGVALGLTMVIVGYLTTIDMDRFVRDRLHDPTIVPFLIVQLSDLPFFAVMFSGAILRRRQPEFHRRLMLVAYCSLLGAAFSRFPHLPITLTSICAETLVLFGVLRDLIVNRRIHKVYLYAIPVLAACQCGVVYVFMHAPALWIRISRTIIG